MNLFSTFLKKKLLLFFIFVNKRGRRGAKWLVAWVRSQDSFYMTVVESFLINFLERFDIFLTTF